MTSEQPPKDALRPLRPLPSINIPLLREERSALRSRRVVRLVLGGVLALCAGVAAFVSSHLNGKRELSDSSDAAPSAPPSEPPPNAPEHPRLGIDDERHPTSAAWHEPSAAHPVEARAAVSPLAASRTEHLFGKAVSFGGALEKNGLSRAEANALIAALADVMDFRRSLPEDTLGVERDSQGRLVRFEYRSGLTQRYEAVLEDGGSFRARQIPVPIRHERVMKGGTVDGSLGDALEGLKLGRSLAGVFTEVFDGQISFSTDTRAGDTFRIIVDEEWVEDTFLRYGTIYALEYHGAKAGLLQAFWHESDLSDGDFYDASGRALHGGWLRTPLRYDHVSSDYGMRLHPVLKRKKLHNGIDYAAGTGTPVRAAAGGVVTFAGPKGPNGNLLAIRHANGYETFYAHLSRFAPGMKKGLKVSQRQLVAYVGSTGRSTGPHLHFSLKRNGGFLDPKTQLNGPGLPMPAKELPEYKRRVRELTGTLGRVAIQAPVPVSTAPVVAGPTDLGEEEL